MTLLLMGIENSSYPQELYNQFHLSPPTSEGVQERQKKIEELEILFNKAEKGGD